jgi:hypothetical protein
MTYLQALKRATHYLTMDAWDELKNLPFLLLAIAQELGLTAFWLLMFVLLPISAPIFAFGVQKYPELADEVDEKFGYDFGDKEDK